MFLRGSLILGIICSFSQFNRAQTPSPTPGDFTLLPGYTLTETTGKDGKTARLTRADGFTVTYLFSAPKNFYERSLESQKDIDWVKTQTINGNRIAVASLKNGEMVVVVDGTYKLLAKPTSLYQVADFLLIAATVPPSGAFGATKSELPGRHGIKLLPGYVYQRGFSKDSSSGSFVREDGYTFGHDIGRMASNRAKQYFRERFEQLRQRNRFSDTELEEEWRRIDEKVEWRQRLNMSGDDLMIVYLKDATLIVSFDHSSANFIGKVDSFEKLVDFMLTVLTYQPKTPNKLPK